MVLVLSSVVLLTSLVLIIKDSVKCTNYLKLCRHNTMLHILCTVAYTLTWHACNVYYLKGLTHFVKQKLLR